jgi:hypothetical protein
MPKIYFLFLLILIFSLSCSEKHSDEPKANNSPETFISLFPDGEMSLTQSKQHLHWWGTDVDGLVVGFFISFDSTHWSFTSKNDSIFTLFLTRTDTSYKFYAAAVDNQGNGVYDSQTGYGPEPFTDLNGNGRWDAGEPFIDCGAIDQKPASIKVPIKNSPPVVSFVIQSDVPDTTFPVASFSWTGTDPDGDETISKYYYVLDDTTKKWNELSGKTTFLTLFKKDGITQGNHCLYLRALDIAGAYSKTVRMPDDKNKYFYIKEPVGDILIVDDYGTVDNSESFYNALFDTLGNGKFKKHDVLDIKYGLTSITKPKYLPPFVNPTLTEIFKLFKYIFWYSDNSPSLEVAQRTLPDFKKAGGKVLFTAAFPENPGESMGSVVDFAPIDGISSTTISFIPQGVQMLPDAQNAVNYPALTRDQGLVPVVFIRSLVPKIDARVMYTLQSYFLWTGNPVLGVKDADKPSFILVGVPLHRFNGGNQQVGAFIIKAFSDLGF